MIINRRTVEKTKTSFIKNFWWVMLVIIVSGLGFNIAIKKRNMAILKMSEKYLSLKMEKECLLVQKEDLQLKNLSQSDPAWIEMVLMKELGVVPESKIKVHFKN